MTPPALVVQTYLLHLALPPAHSRNGPSLSSESGGTPPGYGGMVLVVLCVAAVDGSAVLSVALVTVLLACRNIG
uniref:SFRICE_023104 n=1 Tax=Spodoptera frugiperda TaxID=7108 RepID=A0A2H1VXL6_SPOFR